MADNMRYSPADITVKQGETVRLLIKNSGLIRHELVLGTPQDLAEHCGWHEGPGHRGRQGGTQAE